MIDVARIRTMTNVELAQSALATDYVPEFWYLCAAFAMKLADNTLHRSIAQQMHHAALDTRSGDEAKARDILTNFLKYRRPSDDLPDSPENPS